MRRPVALAVLLGALSFHAAVPEAAAWTPVDSSVPRWGQLPVSYYINNASIPSSIAGFAVARVESGFKAWSSTGCSEWQTSLLGDTTDRHNYNDRKNVFHWVSDSWPNMLGDVNSVIGVTMPAWGFDGFIGDADMVFNNVGFCWNDTGNDGCVDTQSIATHEEGHFLGLGHSSERSATMTPYYVVGASMRTLEDDDVEGVCTLYPIGETMTTSVTTATSATSGGGDGCDSCFNGSLADTCRPQYDACGASTSCRAFAGCYADCQDNTCVERCMSDHAAGASIYIRIIECMCNDCSTECTAECAGFEGGGGSGGGGGGGSGGGGSGGAGGADASSTSTSSTGGESTASATASSSVASGSGVGGADPPTEDPPDDGGSGGDSGCSCSTNGRSADLGGLVLLGVVAALGSRRRRPRAPLGRG